MALTKQSNFPYRLQDLITKRGLKKKAVAHAVGITANTLSRYLMGNLHPHRSTLRALANHLGVTVEDLLGPSGNAASAELDSLSRDIKGLAPDAQGDYIPDAVALTGLDAEDRRTVLFLLQALRSGDAEIRRHAIEQMKLIKLAMEARRQKSREENKDVS